MTRCKPGDLAIVVSAVHRCNLGLIVKVVCLHDRTGDIVFPVSKGTVWWVESACRMKWTMGKKRFIRKRGPAPDSQLQPIRGQPTPPAQRARRKKDTPLTVDAGAVASLSES